MYIVSISCMLVRELPFKIIYWIWLFIGTVDYIIINWSQTVSNFQNLVFFKLTKKLLQTYIKTSGVWRYFFKQLRIKDAS